MFINLNEKRSESIRRYANTTVENDGYVCTVTLHDTEIVRVQYISRAHYGDTRTYKVSLNSGDWRTPTTKKRMNEVARELGLEFGVYQDKREWYVSRFGNDPIPFHDGMGLEVLSVDK